MINAFREFLKTSYTAYQVTENAASFLEEKGFLPLHEEEEWDLREGGRYYVTRGGSSFIAFRFGKGNFKVAASHTDSPCLKLKENAAFGSPFTRLNVEEYGGCLLYTFFDRPLRLAGRIVTEEEHGVRSHSFVSKETVVIPSLAIHMNREANDGFRPDRQTDMLPLLSLKEAAMRDLVGEVLSYDLYAVPAEPPFDSGLHGEFLSSPRLDDLTGVYASLCAIAEASCTGTCVLAAFDSEEIGSRTRTGAASDFFYSVLRRISYARGEGEEDYWRTLSSSLLLSIDNAHSLHPNHPEKCDPTNRAVMGGGVVIKSHAGGAYTSDALTSAAVKKLFGEAGVPCQTFFNRSDMRSGGTLGSISLTKAGIPSVDIGIAQLAMHSAVETIAKEDFYGLVKGLTAFFASGLCLHDGNVAF